MDAKIVGYHRDEENHWVAELDCGHNQHVRHNPPLESRPWVTSEKGRTDFLGYTLNCLLCDERESGTCGKVLGLYSGKIRRYLGKAELTETAPHPTAGRWIDVQSGDDTPAKERIWLSAINKQPLDRPAIISKLGIEGDQQADPKHHGGPDKAVCLYPSEHYPLWETLLQHQLCPSAFGENICSDGLLERVVCVGDQFSVGSAILEISQPRQPCWKIATRWGYPALAKEFLKHAKTGWYFRVIQEGVMNVDDFLYLEERPNPNWTVERVVRARFSKSKTPSEKLALREIPQLSNSWK